MAITKMPGKDKWNICSCGHLLYIQVKRENREHKHAVELITEETSYQEEEVWCSKKKY